MHGVIFAELKRYADSLGPSVWSQLQVNAGIPNRVYLLSQPYPDAEAMSLVHAAATMTGKNDQEVLKDFGTFITPTLLSLYQRLLQPQWRTVDVLEHAEKVVHTVVRLRNAGATPPVLKPTRNGPDTITVEYTSPRKMCSLAIGIIRGLSQHFHEQVNVHQTSCMLDGERTCTIVTRTSVLKTTPLGSKD